MFRRIKPPQTWGELAAVLTFLALVFAYFFREHEHVTALEQELADAERQRPELRDRRDRELDLMHDDIATMRNKLLCPCHD